MLEIREIMELILSLLWSDDNHSDDIEIPRRDLYAFARASRYFSTLALPEVWRCVDEIRPQRVLLDMSERRVSETFPIEQPELTAPPAGLLGYLSLCSPDSGVSGPVPSAGCTWLRTL